MQRGINLRLTSRGAALAALLGLLSAPTAARAERPEHSTRAEAFQAEFRGCESAGWCRFSIESLDPLAPPYRVRPDGVWPVRCDETTCIALRNRLNELLAGMIHQHKHIVLHDLRRLDDGTFAATVTVNGQALAVDPTLMELREQLGGTIR